MLNELTHVNFYNSEVQAGIWSHDPLFQKPNLVVSDLVVTTAF